MRTWGILLILAGVLLLAPIGVLVWAQYFYTIGADGPGVVILPVAGVACLLTGSMMVLRARRATPDQDGKSS